VCPPETDFKAERIGVDVSVAVLAVEAKTVIGLYV
jgi:hypothetical protein